VPGMRAKKFRNLEDRCARYFGGLTSCFTTTSSLCSLVKILPSSNRQVIGQTCHVYSVPPPSVY
jgi:hypothetical protein